LLTVIECGTHALLDAVFDGWGQVDELTLARRAIDRLEPGMLLLADRNFPGYDLWGRATASGADLLWRFRRNLIFTPVRRLPDGSFLSVMGTPAQNARFGRARAAGRPLPGPPAGHPVRIIEYTATITTDAGSRTEAFRLVTTLLDPIAAPATALAELYHQRWEIELCYSELKTRLRGPGFLLRSRSPDLIRQEMFAFLVVYQALTGLRVRAAQVGGIDPDRISFTVTLRLARDHAGDSPAADERLQQALERVIAELLNDVLPPRRARSYQRIKRPAKNTYPSRRPDRPRPPSRATFTLDITDDPPHQGKRPK
jgi:Transposase DDE domain